MKKIMLLRICSLLLGSALLVILYGCSTGDSNAPKTAAVEAVKMNTLYLGVDNPIRIAVSGVPTSQVEVTIDNGTIVGENGDFVVAPKEVGVVKITVSCKGSEIRVAEFKVKRTPDPIAAVKGITERMVDKEALIAGGELEARMPEGFSFDLKFNITSFTLIVTQKGYSKSFSTKDPFLTDDMKKIINELKSGQGVAFTDIKVMCPDGTERDLNDIVYQLN